MRRRWHFLGMCALIACSRPSSSAQPSASDQAHAAIEVPSSTPSCPAVDSARPTAVGGHLDIAGASNARYIGPLGAHGGRHIKPRQLVRSGQLTMVCEDGYAEMVRLGIASVIDLRSVKEMKAAPDAPWVIRGTRHLVLNLPEVVPSDAHSFAQMLDALEPRLGQLFAHLGSPGALPVLVHCGTGKGRACAGMATVLLALGVSQADVAKDFAENQDDGVDPGLLDGLFARVSAAGGIDRYLRQHSVSPSDIDQLRMNALE